MAFFEFKLKLWEVSNSSIVLTDKKSVTRFFQIEAIPPSLWNACDYVLQFNFKIAHIAGAVNTAADFLSRLEVKVIENIRLKIREVSSPTSNVQWVTTSSPDVAILLHTAGWWKWDRKANPRKETEISGKGNKKGRTWGTILKEPKYQRSHKDWRKHYVSLHIRNQGNCTDTSRTRCWSSLEESKTQNTWPATRRCAINNRKMIETLQSDWRPHHLSRCTVLPEIVRRNW